MFSKSTHSVIDVLQPSVVFNNTYEFYNKLTQIVPHPASTLNKAMKIVKDFNNQIPIGIFYKVQKPVFHKELMGEWNPVVNHMPLKQRRNHIISFLSDKSNE